MVATGSMEKSELEELIQLDKDSTGSQLPELVSYIDSAKYLSCSTKTINRLVKAGKLQGKARNSKCKFIYKASLLEYVNSCDDIN